MVGGGDADDIDRFVVEDPANVLFILGRFALGLFGGGHGPADHGLIAVADGRDDAVMLAGIAPDIVAALAVDANHGHVKGIVGIAFFGCFGLGFFGRRQWTGEDGCFGQKRGQGRGVVKKVAPTDGTHEGIPFRSVGRMRRRTTGPLW